MYLRNAPSKRSILNSHVVFSIVALLALYIQSVDSSETTISAQTSSQESVDGAFGSRSQFTGVANRISLSDTRCTLCQYFVQRIQNEMIKFQAPQVWMELNETIVRRKAANGKSTDKLSQSEEDALLLQSFLEVDTEINSNYNSNAHNSYNKNDFGAFDPSNMPSLLENAAAATASLTSTSTATVASQTQLQGQSSAASSTENQASIDPLSPMYSSSTPPPSTALAGTSHSARSIATDFPSSIPPPLPNNREVGKTGAASLLQSQASASTSASTSSATASTVASEQGQGQEGVDFSGPSGGAIKMVDGVLPGRYRLSDILGARPGTARWDTSRPRGPTLQQQQAQYMYKQMYQAVYRNFESVCKERMPQPFIVFCAQTMHDFPRIAQGLHYNDRPDTICMDLKYCDEQSYVFNAPHARFVSERGPP